ncbi:MAG: TonB-dependent receptor [Sphingomicrobium sp.]
MRQRAFFLTTVAAAALAASPAAARTAAGDDANKASQQATEQAAPSGSAAAQPATVEKDAAGNEIIVTGVRASLRSAQQIKRNATQVVDSIVAEDIGKLPDNTVSDALQRVTGIQVRRGGGEAADVLIRGLPRIQSLVNGREVFTGTDRGVQLRDIPAELVAGVDVYKTTTPELIEGSISGLIDIRFRHPLDFPGTQVAGGVRALYGDQVKKWSYIGSGLFSTRWGSPGGSEFGILVGASLNKRNYQDVTAFNFGYTDFGGAPDNLPFIMPLTTGGIYNVGDRKRPAGNISLQWKPNSNLEFYADGFYTGYRENFDVNFFIGIPIAGGRRNFVRQPGSPFAQSVTSDNNFTLTSKQAFRRRTDGYQLAGGSKWNNGPLSLSTDLSYNDSKVRSRALIVDTFFIAPSIDYNFDRNGTPFLKINGIDVTNPANFTLTTLFDNTDHSKSKQFAWRGDAAYDLGTSFLKKLKVGVRYADRKGDQGGSNTSPLPIRPEIPASSLAGFATVSPGGLLDGIVGIDRFVLADSDYLYSHIAQIRAAANQTGNSPPDNPNRVFKLKERTFAGYAQVNYGFDLGSMPIDGVAGVRVINTKNRLDATQVVNNIASPILGKQDYTDVLPSFSIRARLADNIQARFVAGKSITRPEFGELNPAVSRQRAGNTSGGSGNGGNASLNRIKSDNLDATLEWYFARAGSVTASAFYRRLDGYIVAFAAPEVFQDGPDLVTYQITRPRNTGRGKLEGFELAYQQFFDFLPGALSGFGAQANLTYVNGTFTDPGTAGTLRIPQVSKYSYNLVAIYEKYGFSARLAYNWRSSFVDTYNIASAAPPTVNVAPLAFLDFSASYNLNKNITVTVDATNLLDRRYHDQFGTAGTTPRDTRAYDRTFGAGVRFRF